MHQVVQARVSCAKGAQHGVRAANDRAGLSFLRILAVRPSPLPAVESRPNATLHLSSLSPTSYFALMYAIRLVYQQASFIMLLP
jgi:hypothetical protein